MITAREFASVAYVDESVASARAALEERLADLEAVPAPDLAPYATRVYVDEAVAGVAAPDLSPYATTTYVDESIAGLPDPPPPVDLAPYALDADLASHADDTLAIHGIADTSRLITQDNIGAYAPPPDLTGYAQLGQTQTFTAPQTFEPPTGIPLTVRLPGNAIAQRINVVGDSGYRWQINQSGSIEWGAGGPTLDARLWRSAAGRLKLERIGVGDPSFQLGERTWSRDATGSIFDHRVAASGLYSSAPVSIDSGGIGLSVRGTDTGTLAGAGIVGRYSNDFPANTARLGYYLMGGSTQNQAGIVGYASESWTASARGSYMTVETTAVGASARREVARFNAAGDLSVLGGITSAGETVPRSGTINNQTSDVMVNQIPGVRNGVVVKVDGPPTGVYGQDQAFMVLKEGTGVVEPDDLVVFRVDHRGAMGFAGGAHVATGLRARPGDTYQYSIHINPSVDVPGLLVDSANDAPSSAWQQWRLHNGTVIAEVAADQWFKANRGLYALPRAADQPAAVVQQYAVGPQTRSLIEFRSNTGTVGSSIGADTLTFRPTYLENEAKNSPIVALFPTGVVVQARTPTQAALITKAAASQATNVHEWQDSGGVVRSFVGQGANVFGIPFLVDVLQQGSYIAMGTTTVQAQSRVVGGVPFTAAGIAGQTADVQRWIIAPSTVLGGMEPDGDLRLDVAGKGYIAKSPDGLLTRRIGINNAGAVVATVV